MLEPTSSGLDDRKSKPEWLMFSVTPSIHSSAARNAEQNRDTMAKTAFARYPCFLRPAFSYCLPASVELALVVIERGDPAHLCPIIAVLCTAVNANLVILACFVASRPRELMAAGRQESVNQTRVHAV